LVWVEKLPSELVYNVVSPYHGPPQPVSPFSPVSAVLFV
jgi:hypothetical protein